MATLDQFAGTLLMMEGRSKESLEAESLSVSELTLSLTESGEFFLEFETLGQNFLLTPKGLHTFDELGDAYTLEDKFELAVKSFLDWRLKVLIRFRL